MDTERQRSCAEFHSARSVGHESVRSSLETESHISLITMLHLHESCVLSVILNCAETWTLLKADVNRLQAFHMRNLRRILGIRWFDHITNLEMKDRTRLEDIEPRVRRRRLALFGHVARMQPGVPAHDALWIAIGARCGSAPGSGWKRPRGRPGLPGPSSSVGTSMAWASGRLGIWLWIGKSGGSSRRVFAVQA